MFAASIIFILPSDTDWDAIRERAKDRAINVYAHLRGLRTKAFILNKDTNEYGGFYIFETKEALDSFINSDLITEAAKKLGEPKIHTYEIPAYIEDGKLLEVNK